MHTTVKDARLHRIKEMRHETLHCQNLMIFGISLKEMYDSDDLQHIKKINQTKTSMGTQRWARIF